MQRNSPSSGRKRPNRESFALSVENVKKTKKLSRRESPPCHVKNFQSTRRSDSLLLTSKINMTRRAELSLEIIDAM
jgi:hypothetical protein